MRDGLVASDGPRMLFQSRRAAPVPSPSQPTRLLRRTGSRRTNQRVRSLQSRRFLRRHCRDEHNALIVQLEADMGSTMAIHLRSGALCMPTHTNRSLTFVLAPPTQECLLALSATGHVCRHHRRRRRRHHRRPAVAVTPPPPPPPPLTTRRHRDRL